ncbi:MAG TPA: SOS response-associated peptidase [Phycisphaerales bacterium]|nr:SOS response-associated peptidase [Phycisphaerales bacterium]
MLRRMCGRYTHKFTWKELHDLLAQGVWPQRLAQVTDAALFEARFNIAPTQSAPIVRAAVHGGKVTGLEVAPLRWGLAPHWSKDSKRGPINARAETVATNAVFRAAFAARRCIVPVSGFYEWKRTQSPPLIPGAEPVEGPKQPHYITRADGRPLLLAGLWERWGKDGDDEGCVETFAIVTTTANEFMSQVHDRMPVVLEPESAPRWLDPHAEPAALQGLLLPAPDGILQMHPVSPRVNSPRNQGEELILSIG